MTITKANKVAKRGWSLEKFSEAVTRAAKKQEIPVKKISKTKIEKCYEEGVTVRDTVQVLAS